MLQRKKWKYLCYITGLRYFMPTVHVCTHRFHSNNNNNSILRWYFSNCIQHLVSIFVSSLLSVNNSYPIGQFNSIWLVPISFWLLLNPPTSTMIHSFGITMTENIILLLCIVWTIQYFLVRSVIEYCQLVRATICSGTPNATTVSIFSHTHHVY